MSAVDLAGLTGAALVGLGLYGLITNPQPLRKILSFNILGSGVFLIFGIDCRNTPLFWSRRPPGGALRAFGYLGKFVCRSRHSCANLEDEFAYHLHSWRLGSASRHHVAGRWIFRRDAGDNRPCHCSCRDLRQSQFRNKTALFPLHMWLPPAHANAPAAASAILSALVVKASFFLIARLWFNVLPGEPNPYAMSLLAALGAAAILFGSVLALRQARLKLLIAYSTVAQIGYLFIMFPLAGGLNSWSTEAFSGGVMQLSPTPLPKLRCFFRQVLLRKHWGMIVSKGFTASAGPCLSRF